MRIWAIGLVAAVGALALSGCATLSEEECLIGDWRQIGFSDGASGKRPSILGNHGEACAKFGVGTDYELWRAGYEAGLDTFCTPENALQLGARGASYGGVCAGDRGVIFQAAYADGLVLHSLMEDAYARSEDVSLSEAERDDAFAEARSLDRRIGRLKRRIDRIEAEYGTARREVDALRDQLLLNYRGASLRDLPVY